MTETKPTPQDRLQAFYENFSAAFTANAPRTEHEMTELSEILGLMREQTSKSA
jgi:hypothetical protein